MALEVTFDFDDGRHGFAHRAEKFEAYRADRRRHAVQHERGFGDDAVAALFLDAGQAAQHLVGDVLAEAALAEGRAGDFEDFRHTSGRLAVAGVTRDTKTGDRDVMNLAEVVVETLDQHPLCVRRHHFP